MASVVLSERIGALCANLRGWHGARVNQDNVLWKPPGSKPLGFHQDESYQSWIVPSEFVTCWIALDDTTADGGTIEYVRGSHRWALAPPIDVFHAPTDPRAEMRRAAAEESSLVGEDACVDRIEVPAGGAVFHHGRTWHGSGTNRSAHHRRALVVHCMPGNARFHPTNVGYIYNRYKRYDSDEMDESFFPILWRRNGNPSAFVKDYVECVKSKENMFVERE